MKIEYGDLVQVTEIGQDDMFAKWFTNRTCFYQAKVRLIQKYYV